MAFTTLPRVTGALSMFGSGWIVYEVLSNEKKRSDIQQRILLGMGLTDFLTSFHYVLGTMPFPEEDGGLGNHATCDVSGFIGQFVPATAIYNAFLGLYYLYTIKYSWRSQQLQTLEMACHVSAVSFAIITGIICVHLELFNPAFVHCWIADYPKGCSTNPDVECTRGDGDLATALGWAFYYVPVYIGFIIAATSMALVFFHVRSVEQKTIKFSLRQSQSHFTSTQMEMISTNSITDANSSTLESLKASKKEESKAAAKVFKAKQKLQLSRRVFNQGMWYLFAFFATWFWPTVTTIFESVGQYHYWILVLLAITLPAQGFLNWIIYIRPRFLKYREKHSDWSFGYALYRALAKPFAPLCASSNAADEEGTKYAEATNTTMTATATANPASAVSVVLSSHEDNVELQA